MRRINIIVVLAVLAFAAVAGWQVGSCELANLQLQEDLHDLASGTSARYGYTAPRSADAFRDVVIDKAREHGIELEGSQVTVQQSGEGLNTTTYLAADYSVPVNLARFSFVLHFTPSSTKKAF